MSDPYGSNSGSNPYGPPSGQTPPPPPPAGGYGGGAGGGYGGGFGPPPGGFPGGGDSMPPKTDGLSIAALVLSFLCCLAPIGVILGIVGIRRTKGGQRKGRGLAIAAIIIGVIMSIATASLIAVGVFFADKVVTPGNAEVGQCVDVDENDDTIFLYKKECTEKHDAEIVGIAKVDSSNIEEIKSSMAGYCATAIAAEDLAKLSAHLQDVKAVIEDPKKVEKGDHLVCYVEPSDQLTEPLL
ncbi:MULTISPECIES: DUF4190 domain-containing protein [unclassified Nocardioides]|uniref:DUF4190 domain-containing protein n=1 Tax=unclassified Nocardioides TaxID=2615069 RepID=UPI0007025971|nr:MULTISPECIES: DUF4190 domain-containing protein [unclassified Nocardioides]KRC46349.1 hypothetical protein ASE19_21175 [Nocardioides sp. Root79]KRC69696.1 hypothetical protein ASE20_14035 [Nocardioides sp. Root240]